MGFALDITLKALATDFTGCILTKDYAGAKDLLQKIQLRGAVVSAMAKA